MILSTQGPGAQRAEMLLQFYDPDEQNRLYRVLADLADYCHEKDLDLEFMTRIALAHTSHHRRRATRELCEGEEDGI